MDDEGDADRTEADEAAIPDAQAVHELPWRDREEVFEAVMEGRAVADPELAAVAVAHARRWAPDCSPGE